jgi:hypothetical protein
MSWRAAVDQIDQVRAKGIFFTSRVISMVFTVPCCCTLLQVCHAPSLKSLVLIFMEIKEIKVNRII